jgi:hypothetical protein
MKKYFLIAFSFVLLFGACTPNALSEDETTTFQATDKNDVPAPGVDPSDEDEDDD